MITLALIGVGKWGQNYLHTVSSLKDVQIKYICAQNQQTLNLFPDTYIKTQSLEKLYKNKQIDGFIIATPANTHFSIADKLISSGHNLLIEKPLTTNYQQALKLQREWEKLKPQILIGHTYLYNPAYQAFKKEFNNLSKIKKINFEGLVSPTRNDISVIWDWGPHPISILLDLIKQPISKVKASGCIKGLKKDLFDTASIELEFVNGVKAFIKISWFGKCKTRKLSALGENERIEFDDANDSNQKVSVYYLNKPVQYPEYGKESSLSVELKEFVKAIRNNHSINSDISLGIEVVRVLSIIEESVISNGKTVMI